MAKATDRSKAGNVTVATVRKRDEAYRLVQQLEAAGMECALVEERLTVPAGAGRSRSGGIKVQVDRSVAKQAIELLREQNGEGFQPKTNRPSRSLGFAFRPTVGCARPWKSALSLRRRRF